MPPSTGRGRCGSLDWLDGPGGRRLPHVVGHRGVGHRLRVHRDEPQDVEQEHFRLRQGRGPRSSLQRRLPGGSLLLHPRRSFKGTRN